MMIQKWKQCGTAVQGKDHIASGTVCQDSVAALSHKGVHAIALSDGGGSRRFSDIGSACATRAICELLTANFDEYYARLDEIEAGHVKAKKLLLALRLEMLDAVLAALRAEVTPERTLRDFGCTLQFAAVKEGRFIVGHVGDGVIAGLYQRGPERRVEVLSHPENGGAPNITFFVTDHNAKDHLRLTHGECRQLEGILMMSDGPEEVLYSTNGGMHPNTLKLFDNFKGLRRADYTAALEKFLAGSIAQHSFDDLSLNLLYLECAEREKLHPLYLEELLGDVKAASQVRRVSAYTYYLDPSLPPCGSDDLSFLRGEA